MKMRVRFYIEKRRGEDGKLMTKRRPIFMTVAFHGERVMISTGRFVDLKWWDHGKQRVKELHPEAEVINGWLNTLRYTANAVWKALDSLSENPGAADFRREFKRMRPRFSRGFFEIMYQFMEEGSDRWSSGSYRKVRSFYNQLRVFEKETGIPVRFDTLNGEFLERFRTYNAEAGRSPVTIRKMVNTLVWFLNWASKEGYNIYPDYRKFYRGLEEPKPIAPRVPVYLEWEELMKLCRLTVGTPVKQRANDLFCLMSLTGLRTGELARLTRDDLTGDALLVRKKGELKRRVPLNDLARELLSGYANRYYRDNLALPPVSVVTINKYMRIIARELGFRRLVPDPGDPAVKRELHEVITAGTAVQTFIMHALRLGIPAEVIATYTGVASDRRIALLRQEMAESEIKKFNDIGNAQ